MNYSRPKPSPRRFRRSDSATQIEYQSLEPRLALASIQVIAAGETNAETLVLQIDGQAVRTWNNLGGDANSGQFVTLSHTTAGPLSANQVRLAFTNDLYDPANGIDRNVRIDAIVIDGVRYETESSQVFSTGTWSPVDGIVPGFRQSEYLHGSGYFQYSSSGNSGTLIQMRASGDEGGEQMELRIDGLTVSSYVVTTAWTNFQFVAPGTVAASRIRVAFTNDLYDPTNGIDRNLNVDWIAVGGVTYETEGPNVLSTGTWRSTVGIQPGFLASQTLHAQGYFQYETPRNFGSISLQTSVINVAENAAIANLSIVRTGGSDGTITVDYRTVALTASAGPDFVARAGTVTFLTGETSKLIPITILDDAIVEGDEQFSFTIDNVQGGAALLAPRTATITIQDNDAIRAAGTGLLGEYFDNPGFTARFINRVDTTVNFNWGVGAPAAGMGVDSFSVRWTGKIEPRFTETYTFRTRTDDGVRLWVNSQLIIDSWLDQSATVRTGTISLQAGVFADIRLEYYENTGEAIAELSWSSIRQPLEIIPRSQLYAAEPPPVTPGDSLRTQTLYTGLVQPTAMDFSPDGSNVYMAEQRGIIRVARNGNLLTTPFLDFRDRINGTRDRGLLDIAVHPDFTNNPFVYLIYTYDPPQTSSQSSGTLAGPDGNGNRAGRVTRVTADAATDYTTIVPNSEIVIVGKNSTWNNFNAFANSTSNFSEPAAGQLSGGGWVQDFIATDSESHTVGSVEFGPDGMLYASIGDGTSYNQVDPRTSRVQDVNNLSGKILRVDPLTGRGLSNNPFFNGDAESNRSKVWQLGLRNPFRIALHPTNGNLYIGDVGWTQWEELNSAPAGANFGWPWYEGGSGNSLQTGGYKDLPAGQAFYASGQPVTPAVYALNHAASGINAIVMGDVYTGNTFPAQYRDNVFFGDLGQGIIRNVRFNANGSVAQVQTFATGHRYVVQMVQGPDGNLYFVDLDDGLVGRWTFVEGAANAVAAGVVATAAPASMLPITTAAGAGVTIATIDSGVDPDHPQLIGKLWTNDGEIAGDGIDNDRNGLVDDVHGYDFVDSRGQLTDQAGHGTFIAGLIAGGSFGALNGIAPDARVMPLRVLNAQGIGRSIDVAAAIRYAVDNGANIISLSLDVDGDSLAIRDALAWAEEKNVFVVVAAGNDGAAVSTSLAKLSGHFGNVLSAGALDASGSRLPESNLVGDSGAVQIDANGVAFGSASAGIATTYRGTSVATGMVSGAAALVLSVNPNLSSRQLRELLIASGSLTRSGSDSVATLEMSAAVALATRLNEVGLAMSNNRLTIEATAADDVVQFSVQTSKLRINGVTFELPQLDQLSQVILEGRGGEDRVVLTGSLDGNDFGFLHSDYVSLATPTRFVRGNGFKQMELLAGDGNTNLAVYGSVGNDELTVRDNEVLLQMDGKSLQASHFRYSRVYASAGNDTAQFMGTAANERLLAGAEFTRLFRGTTMVQADRFSSVVVALEAGFDSVIFQGSVRDEALTLSPFAADFSGSDFQVSVSGLERTTTYAGGGFDQLMMFDGPGRDRVNSMALNTLLVGQGYDHRAYQFDKTIIHSTGGLDSLTLRGSVGREVLESTPVVTRFAGAGFETEVWGFPTINAISGGGNDSARLFGSAANDHFWSSSSLAVLNSAGNVIALQQFRDVEFDGNGGNDVATLVDGGGAAELILDQIGAALIGEFHQVKVRGISRLRANSLVDEPIDRIRFQAAVLDYQFEFFGDWQF